MGKRKRVMDSQAGTEKERYRKEKKIKEGRVIGREKEIVE